jgi:transcriptional regulator with XRE-family HTH domain
MTLHDQPNRIREWRNRRRMSLAELGETVGLSRSEISKLENGSRRVRAEHLVILAKALKVPPEELMDRDTVRDMLGEIPQAAPAPAPVQSMLPVRQSRRQGGMVIVPEQETPGMTVEAPPQLANVPGAYAFYMPDTSYEPRVPVGALLMVNTVLPPRAGDMAVVHMDGGAEPFLAAIERQGDRLVAVANKDTAPVDLNGPHVARTHRIAGVWFA